MRKTLLALGLLFPLQLLAGGPLWTLLDERPQGLNEQAGVQPRQARITLLHTDILADRLAQPNGTIELPAPDGRMQRFRIRETEVMHPDLARRFPTIRTFSGAGSDHPRTTLRMDITPQGFHAQVLTPQGSWYIDPWWKENDAVYSSYWADELGAKDFACGFKPPKQIPLRRDGAAQLTTGSDVKTYRLAVAAQGEYTQFHGGTVTGALAAIVTTINRVNAIFERECAIRLQLVPNNDLIIYTNPGTDPYSLNDASITTLNQNQTHLDSVIGSANYDVGHVFNTGGGGLAGAGICSAGKARGVTGSSTPFGDAFDVDLVTHELGHQFGANHTFNGVNGNCSGNRNGATAYEIGSGSTIMGYAGICTIDNVQNFADDYFHAITLEEIN
ncbi:MAG: reprolysin-like metallopeptidase, partial [Verrucomicrobiota bacterium]